jgi:hypothetical protein
MCRSSCLSARFLLPAAILASIANVAGGADWSFDPRVTLNADYDDNNRLTNVPGQEIEVTGALIDAQATIGAATPRSDFWLIPRVRATIYPEESDEETDSEFLTGGYEFRGQRYTGNIDAEYSRRETLGRYLPDDFDDGIGGDPGDGDDLGIDPTRNVQKRLVIAPDASFEVTERSRLELGVGYLDVAFDEQVQDDREDYTSLSGDVAYRYLVSPTKSVALRLRGRQYDPADDVATDSHAVELEWSNDISETSRIYVRGGGNRVEQIDEFGDSEWNTGFTGGAGAIWTYEVTDLLFELTRGLDPNSSGRLVARDEMRVRLTRRVSPVTRLLFSARGVRDEQSTEQDDFQERRYASASLGFEWRMSRQFTLEGGYVYVWRSIENQPNDAESNRLYFGVTWEPHRL